jgi:hypothetical protein
MNLTDVSDIVKQTEYYRKMQKIERARDRPPTDVNLQCPAEYADIHRGAVPRRGAYEYEGLLRAHPR